MLYYNINFGSRPMPFFAGIVARVGKENVRVCQQVGYMWIRYQKQKRWQYETLFAFSCFGVKNQQAMHSLGDMATRLPFLIKKTLLDDLKCFFFWTYTWKNIRVIFSFNLYLPLNEILNFRPALAFDCFGGKSDCFYGKT